MATDRYSDDHKIVVGGGSGTLTVDATLDVSSTDDINIESNNDINIESNDGDINLTTNNHDINLTTNNGVVSIDGMNIYRDSLLSHHIDYPVEIIWHSDYASNHWNFDQNTSFSFLNDSTYYNLAVSTNNLYLSSRDDVYIRAGIDTANSTLWLSANGDLTPYIEMLKSTDRVNIYGGGTSHLSVYSGAIFATAGGDAYLNVGLETILMTGNHPVGGAGVDEQVVDIFNAANSNDADVLYLSVGYSGDATPANNFIVFFDHGLGVRDIGSIQGDGSGGISLNSGSADYAEWLEIADPSEWSGLLVEGYQDVLGIKEGTLVWVRNSKIYRSGGITPRIITKRAIVTGNSPRGNAKKKSDGSNIIGEKVSFIGQVPVSVVGPVFDGWYLIPEQNKSCCIGVSPSSITFEQYRSCIGTAWETNESEDEKIVNCAIGIK